MIYRPKVHRITNRMRGLRCRTFMPLTDRAAACGRPYAMNTWRADGNIVALIDRVTRRVMICIHHPSFGWQLPVASVRGTTASKQTPTMHSFFYHTRCVVTYCRYRSLRSVYNLDETIRCNCKIKNLRQVVSLWVYLLGFEDASKTTVHSLEIEVIWEKTKEEKSLVILRCP